MSPSLSLNYFLNGIYSVESLFICLFAMFDMFDLFIYLFICVLYCLFYVIGDIGRLKDWINKTWCYWWEIDKLIIDELNNVESLFYYLMGLYDMM